jgi:hypothetical protein
MTLTSLRLIFRLLAAGWLAISRSVMDLARAQAVMSRSSSAASVMSAFSVTWSTSRWGARSMRGLGGPPDSHGEAREPRQVRHESASFNAWAGVAPRTFLSQQPPLRLLKLFSRQYAGVGLAQVFGLPQEVADRECRNGREAEQDRGCLGCVAGPSCQLLSCDGCGERGGP